MRVWSVVKEMEGVATALLEESDFANEIIKSMLHLTDAVCVKGMVSNLTIWQ